MSHKIDDHKELKTPVATVSKEERDALEVRYCGKSRYLRRSVCCVKNEFFTALVREWELPQKKIFHFSGNLKSFDG